MNFNPTILSNGECAQSHSVANISSYRNLFHSLIHYWQYLSSAIFVFLPYFTNRSGHNIPTLVFIRDTFSRAVV